MNLNELTKSITLRVNCGALVGAISEESLTAGCVPLRALASGYHCFALRAVPLPRRFLCYSLTYGTHINSSLWLDGFVKRIGADKLAVLLDGNLCGDGSRAVEKDGDGFVFWKSHNNAILRIRLNKLRLDRRFDRLFAGR